MPAATWKLGTELRPEVQRECLNKYVHRFTREYKPDWAERREWKPGVAYPVHFASDAEWLAHSRFAVTRSGALDGRVKHCESTPTWPDGVPTL